MIIDANNRIVGRIGSYAAKQALLGEKIDIINCEKAIISASREGVFAKYKQKQDMGGPRKGPFLIRLPDRFVRRIIRGMLPMERARGQEAYKRIMCYIGVPEEFKGKPCVDIPGTSANELVTLKKVSVGDVCRFLGGKWNDL
ncbi:50S ribosomal protein L13 [Candidatus Woesearchaeota archaeon]|nr:50S ribosomal protein L13 [Candidatus Woesearchaeota archaeon]